MAKYEVDLESRGSYLKISEILSELYEAFMETIRRLHVHPSPSFYRSNMTEAKFKTNKWHVRPAKSQISLGIRPVWSESSLCTQWVAKDQSFLHADSDDSDQTWLWSDWADAQADLRLRWEHMPFCWFCREAAHIIIKAPNHPWSGVRASEEMGGMIVYFLLFLRLALSVLGMARYDCSIVDSLGRKS